MNVRTGLLLLVCISLLNCKSKNANKNFESIQQDFSFTKEGELYLIKATGDTIQKLDIEFARDEYERETGLMHREQMEANQGMLFIFEEEAQRGFFMKNTLIPLDLIYIDSKQKIVSFAENAQPLDETTLPSQVPAQYVLEINAGLSEEWGLDIGDSVSWK